jgi:HSP20 family molecular chaperone IbpA
MNANPSVTHLNKIRVMAVDSAEQVRRIDEAIARRAYEIFELRGGTGWHELEDWRKAESEVRSKLCFSLSTAAASLRVGFDVAHFQEGTVEVWVAPQQMTICGKPIPHKEQSERAARLYEGMVFRAIALPVEVDPGRAVANVKRNFVEIRLPLACVTYGVEVPAKAA